MLSFKCNYFNPKIEYPSNHIKKRRHLSHERYANFVLLISNLNRLILRFLILWYFYSYSDFSYLFLRHEFVDNINQASENTKASEKKF